MTLAELSEATRRSRRKLDQRVGEYKGIVSQIKTLQTQIEEEKQLLEVLDKTVVLLNSIGEEKQNHAQQQIESLVTYGLKTIFEEDLSFHVVSSYKANAAHLDFVVRTTKLDGQQIDTSVLDARGGGLASIVGFLLRVVQMLLSPERQRLLLVLDETFAAVSAEYEVRLAEFVKELVARTNLQIILVTHSTAFSDAADVVYRVSLEHGKSVVEQA